MSGRKRERKSWEKARAVTACVLSTAGICVFAGLIIINACLLASAEEGLPRLGGERYCLCTERGGETAYEKVFARVEEGGEIEKGARLIYRICGGYTVGYVDHVTETNGKKYAVVKDYPGSEGVTVLPEVNVCGEIAEEYPAVGSIIYWLYKYKLGIIVCASALMLYESAGIISGVYKGWKNKEAVLE